MFVYIIELIFSTSEANKTFQLHFSFKRSQRVKEAVTNGLENPQATPLWASFIHRC